MSYVAEILADSPLLYWRLGESVGTVAEDATANNRDGTYRASGVTYSVAGALAGDADTAVTFNGTAGSVISAAAVDPATNIVTFECIAKIAAFANDFDVLAEFSPSWGANNGSFLSLPNDSGGAWLLGIRGTTTNASRTFTRPSTGVFHHLVFVYDMSTATTRFVVYVDNVVQTLSGTGNTTSANFGNYVLNVGGRVGTSLNLAVTLDEVAFYAGELSSARVAAHFAAISATSFVPRAIVI